MPTTSSIEKQELYQRGVDQITAWCHLNKIEPPIINNRTGKPEFNVCAYYRNGVIHIWTNSCAAIGRVGRQWSYPGYVVDRTPSGVLAHELGHHVTDAHGADGGLYCHQMRTQTDEESITSYCPNTNEWFAEIFRLFITNPDLLGLIRPECFRILSSGWKPIEKRSWIAVLAGASRQLKAANNKIKKAQRRSEKQGRLL